MILDEAQAIKNINSIRWQTLLTIKARNKLLLTGTPIQNSMAELWALLHFIMPSLFNSHEQFQEWFSKDIEEAAHKDKSTLNQHQLQRLHMILKPFMLRRVKKDVEHEIGKKIEITVSCEMTRRQQRFYDSIKAKLSLSDFFLMLENKQKVENLMNLVMQFRKVCNHPELFERRPNRTTYVFQDRYCSTSMQLKFGEIKPLIVNTQSPIAYTIPKLVFDSLMANSESKTQYIKRKLPLFTAQNIYEDHVCKGKMSSLFSFIRFMKLSYQFFEFAWNVDEIYLQVILLHYLNQVSQSHFFHWQDEESKTLKYQQKDCYSFLINRKVFDFTNVLNEYDHRINNVTWITSPTAHNMTNFLGYNPRKYAKYIPLATASTIRLTCSSAAFTKWNYGLNEATFGYKILFGDEYSKPQNEQNSKITIPKGQLSILPKYDNLFKEGYLNTEYQESMQNIEIVDFSSLVADSSKLKYLDTLLQKLKREGHRVLIFCQMTKMLNILEDFMNRRQYLFFRLDGSTNISDRKDMVTEFQTNSKIFCFLLSTRAGGLGITLTAADVVIFYDNDWNPTMDQQATDRAHRIGQQKDVYVYKMVTKGTIEERIVKRAQRKLDIQSTVYGSGSLKADIMKPQEVMELLFDEKELNTQQQHIQAKLQNRKTMVKKKYNTKKNNTENNKKEDVPKGTKKKGKKEENAKGKGKNSKNEDNNAEDEAQNMDMEEGEQDEQEDDYAIDLHKLDDVDDDEDGGNDSD
uniref:Chromatin-remodeling ATPase INO80 n=1 Tax=Philasterides dicentrarchi TaxID=282688 RepID=A0A481XSQ5_9CILI|nr:helicase SRCAP isoform X1 [Philasterides dicentrarchi]